MSPAWYRLSNADEVPSPALLVCPERIRRNIRRMIEMTGGPDRLRPHVKTHKMAEVVAMHLVAGIRRFKCATVAEAEMLAGCGAPDVLIAYPPVGPNAVRVWRLVERFPETRFCVTVDSAVSLEELSRRSVPSSRVGIFLDLDVGQHRTGLSPGPEALEVYRRASRMPCVNLLGLHAYDGQIRDRDPLARSDAVAAAIAPVLQLRKQIQEAGFPQPILVLGGTPTFPSHASRGDGECSPGTCVLSDAGYSENFPDLDFEIAAVLLTRVISKPGPGRLCLDLGHKAVASEMPPPRVRFPELPDACAVIHSEEHFVVKTSRAGEFNPGDCLYGIPWHICPTVALHGEVIVVERGKAVDRWRVVARERQLTI